MWRRIGIIELGAWHDIVLGVFYVVINIFSTKNIFHEKSIKQSESPADITNRTAGKIHSYGHSTYT